MNVKKMEVEILQLFERQNKEIICLQKEIESSLGRIPGEEILRVYALKFKSMSKRHEEEFRSIDD